MRNAWRSIVPLLLLTVIMAGCSSQRVIVQDLDQPEANEIVVILGRAGIAAEKTKQETQGAATGEAKYQVTVTASDRDRALDFLNQQGLPRPRGKDLLGIFSGGGLVPSPIEQKIKYESGQKEELAAIIRKFDGVLDAAVQISIPEDNPLAPEAQKKEITAAVYVKHNGVLDDPNSQAKTKIKNIVAGAISGLKPENISVIDERVKGSSDASMAPGEGAENEKQYVRVWSVIVAKESVGRFQTFFFSLSLLSLLLSLAVVWMMWKFLPVIHATGGFRGLLRPHPVQPKDLQKAPAPAPVTAEKTPTKSASEEDEDEEQ